MYATRGACRRLAAVGRFADAIDAAMTAISADPLRESAQRALIEAHLAEGNWGEAERAYRSYRTLVRDELGVEPTAELSALLHQRTAPLVSAQTG